MLSLICSCWLCITGQPTHTCKEVCIDLWLHCALYGITTEVSLLHVLVARLILVYTFTVKYTFYWLTHTVCMTDCSSVFLPQYLGTTVCSIKGQIYYPPGHCKPCDGTCKVPNPPCPRSCWPGCACPRGKVVHKGKCIPLKLCPSVVPPISECYIFGGKFSSDNVHVYTEEKCGMNVYLLEYINNSHFLAL